VLRKLADEQQQKKSLPPAAGSSTTDSENTGVVAPQTVSVPGCGSVGVFSEAMRAVVELAYRLHEDRTMPALIEGETGTGKEVVARLIHHGRGESDAPFICINCPAIAPTLFESELFGYEAGSFTGAKKSGAVGKLELAQGGTLFLDEIGDLPLDMQPKLLRVLQERERYRVGGGQRVALDVRIIAATNAELQKAVDAGRFRRDLFYRLNPGHVRIPPLRERPAEIIHLAQLILARLAEEKRRAFRYITPEARAHLESYLWPGNVRELENAIERVTLLYNEESVRAEHLNFLAKGPSEPLSVDMAPLSPDNFVLPEDGLDIDALNEAILRRVLAKFKGNKSEAARYLKLTRGSFRRRADHIEE
jgi:transcriptional regulator with PAS, ATPase and Fis domain